MIRFLLYVSIFFLLWYIFKRIIKLLTAKKDDVSVKTDKASNKFSNIEDAKFEDITDKKGKE